jgi:hypothetical protein
LNPYYHRPQFWLWYWGTARLWPCYHHQSELYAALGMDLPANVPATDRFAGDRFGWRGAWPGGAPAETKERIAWQVGRYRRAVGDPDVAEGPVRAFRDLLGLCRDQNLPVILLMPPQGSAFQSFRAEAEEVHAQAVVDLANEFGLPLVDARAWIGDDSFSDGHHLTEAGAEAYSRRLGQEVLRPHWALVHQVAKDIAQR